MNKFVDDGYVIVKNALSDDLLLKIQDEMLFVLGEKRNTKKSIFFNKYFKTKINYYDVLKPIFEHLLHKNFLDEIVTSKKLFKKFNDILGKDLAYCCDPSLTINLPNKSSSLKNYLFKDWHQEIWSGASHRSIQIWTPLYHSSSKDGQMEIIPKSHLWGHIPHENRAPKKFADAYKTIKTNLEYGDVIIFSTLLLHRSIPTSNVRISLPLLIHNIRYDNNSFEKLRNFKIFSSSEITMIERKLGNHYLSPFRLNQSNDLI